MNSAEPSSKKLVSAAESKKALGAVKAAALPAGEALAATHVGPYANLNQSHKALWGHAEKPGLEKATPVWEIYVDDPGDT